MWKGTKATLISNIKENPTCLLRGQLHSFMAGLSVQFSPKVRLYLSLKGQL